MRHLCWEEDEVIDIESNRNKRRRRPRKNGKGKKKKARKKEEEDQVEEDEDVNEKNEDEVNESNERTNGEGEEEANDDNSDPIGDHQEERDQETGGPNRPGSRAWDHCAEGNGADDGAENNGGGSEEEGEGPEHDHLIPSCDRCTNDCYTLPCRGCGSCFCDDCLRNGYALGRDCQCGHAIEPDILRVEDDERMPAERDATNSVQYARFLQTPSVASWYVARLPIRTIVSEILLTGIPDEGTDSEEPDQGEYQWMKRVRLKKARRRRLMVQWKVSMIQAEASTS